MKRTIFYVISVCLMCGSCEKREFPVELTLNCSIVSEGETKADLIYGGEFMLHGAEIGVFLQQTGMQTYDGRSINNWMYKYKQIQRQGMVDQSAPGAWIWQGEKIYLSPTSATMYAYYPYFSGANIEAIPIDINDNIDYMYAKTPAVSNKDSNVHLDLKHAFSCIRLKIQKGSYNGQGLVSNVGYSSSALFAQGTLNAKTGVISPTGASNPNTSKIINKTIEAATAPINFFAICTGVDGNITFNLEVDGVHLAKSIAIPAGGYSQGSIYEYTIIVDAGKLRLSSVSIEPWANQQVNVVIDQEPLQFINRPARVGDIVVYNKQTTEFGFIEVKEYLSFDFNNNSSFAVVGILAGGGISNRIIAAIGELPPMAINSGSMSVKFGLFSSTDGRANTTVWLQLVSDGLIPSSPAVQACRNYSIDGVPGFGAGQWYMPAQKEIYNFYNVQLINTLAQSGFPFGVLNTNTSTPLDAKRTACWEPSYCNMIYHRFNLPASIRPFIQKNIGI